MMTNKVKRAATKVFSGAKSLKTKYDAAYGKAQESPSKQKLKKMMKVGYRP